MTILAVDWKSMAVSPFGKSKDMNVFNVSDRIVMAELRKSGGGMVAGWVSELPPDHKLEFREDYAGWTLILHGQCEIDL